MTVLFRRQYLVTLYTSEPGLDLRDEIGEALIDIESESILRGTVENHGEEVKVSEEEAEQAFEAAEVGFAAMSEEDYEAMQKDEDE